jgi:hypothetical protein
MKITPRFVLHFVGEVAKELIISSGTNPHNKNRQRPVERSKTQTSESDEFFEEIQQKLGAGYTSNDLPHLPDVGVPPEKHF